MKDVVIGRPGYDNYLVARAVAERGRVSSVDVTNALVALHQTDDDGVKAGHRARADRAWLQRWIRPSDVCVEVEERVVAGVLGELCGSVVVVVREGDYVE